MADPQSAGCLFFGLFLEDLLFSPLYLLYLKPKRVRSGALGCGPMLEACGMETGRRAPRGRCHSAAASDCMHLSDPAHGVLSSNPSPRARLETVFFVGLTWAAVSHGSLNRAAPRHTPCPLFQFPRLLRGLAASPPSRGSSESGEGVRLTSPSPPWPPRMLAK